jgi:C-terminal processing protease CtpA/Prc
MKVRVMLPVLIALSGVAVGAGLTTEQRVENLTAFAKLYGYVRFFHPSDEASRIDQDRLAIYGAQQVWRLNDRAHLKPVLEAMFRPIAPTLQVYHNGDIPSLVPCPSDTAGMEVVAWQHHGAGMGNQLSTFYSLRANRQDDGTAGNLVMMLSAEPYLGKTIRLEAAAKAELQGRHSLARVMLCLDKSDYKPDLTGLRAVAPVTSRDWQRLEVSMPVDSSVRRLFIGGQLLGDGRLWLDAFRLQFRDMKGRWHDARIPSSGFEGPAAQPGAFRMREEEWMFNGPGLIADTTSTSALEGRRSLLVQTDTASLIPRCWPPARAYRDKDLGCGLMCRLPIALYSDSFGTWGRNDSFPYARLDSALRAMPGELSTDSVAVRLADVTIAWNVAQHFYPYFDVAQTDWDSALTTTLQEAAGDTDQLDFIYTLRRMLTRLKDGHAGAWTAAMGAFQPLPFWADWIEGQLVVLTALDSAGLKPGDIVVNIDSVPAEQYLREREQFISGSPQWKRVVSAVLRTGSGMNGTEANLEVRRGDSVFRCAVARSPFRPHPRASQAPMCELKPGVWYVDMCRVPIADVEKKMKVLVRAKGVIFDMRGYPTCGGELVSHLLTSPDTSDKWERIPVIIYPDQESIPGWDLSGWALQPEKPHIAGKTVFLANAWSMSNPECILSFVEHYRLADIVGEPTAGALGIFNPLTLPGGVNASFANMRVVKHDGSQHQLVGILPTVPVTRTIKATREGRDEYIEKALEAVERSGN